MNTRAQIVTRDNFCLHRTARRQLEAGWPIIPLAPKGETPLNPGGCSAPITEWPEFASYIKQHPKLNYAIVTGEKSELVVINIADEIGEASLQQLEKEGGHLPKTICVLTGSGRQFHFFSNNSEPSNKFSWRPGIDVRANGGYIVGVGSIHSSVDTYRYAEGRGPKDVDIADLPEWLEAMLAAGSREMPVTTTIFETGLEARVSSSDEAENVMERVLADDFSGGQHLLYCSDNHFWAFKQTHWQVLPLNNLQQTILRGIQSQPARKGASTSALLSQVVALLKARCAEAGDPLRFRSDPPCVINCRNCEVWIGEDGSLDCRPHAAQSYLRQLCDVDYDPQAACPLYDRAVEQIFGASEDPSAMAGFWDELAGYVMQPARPRAMIIVGRGTGSNGKTALVRLLVQLIGHNFVTALPIQDIEANRFAIAGLDGKLLLLDDDVKTGTRLPDGQLKKLSEAKMVTGEHKFGNSFQFVVRAVPMLLCNNPPSVTDLSHGLRRRLIVVPFKQQFSDEAADINLFTRIAATEMPGVLNRYLAGLSRMIARGWRLEKPAAIDVATVEFVEGANPLPNFIAEELEKAGRAKVADLFSRYEQWCKNSGITFKQQRMHFKRNLENLGYKVIHGNQGQVVIGLQHRASTYNLRGDRIR